MGLRNRGWLIWLCIGIVFLLNAVFGRYLVLPGYLSSLESGVGSIGTASQSVPVWKIIRYLAWAYSFKLGIFFVAISALVRTSIPKTRFWVLVGGGILYLLLAYVPVPGPYPLFFGIGGGLITVLLILIFIRWSEERKHLKDPEKTAADYRLIAYFFFAMATYNLCPLLGVKTFGLYPEKMLRYGAQAEAASFASHVMIELFLGWIFIFLSYRRGVRRSNPSL